MAARQSYVGQLARRLAREGLSLTVECHASLSLAAMTSLLPRLPLQHYDLIVLQPGHAELQRPASLRSLFASSPQRLTLDNPAGKTANSWFSQLQDGMLLTGLRLLAGLLGLPRLRHTRYELRTVLDGLQSWGHNVIIVTPFPHRDPISNWLRQRGRRVFMEEGYRAFMPVFDAYGLLDVGDVCFLRDNQSQLNALGHELVGSGLYDFLRAGVQIVGDSSSYRRHE